MSGKKGDKRLGRNPFEHTRPSRRAKRHQPGEDSGKEGVRAKPVIRSVPEPATEDGSGNDLFQANPVWLFVDLWTSALTDPYFFWAKSMDIVKKSMELK